MSLNLCTSNANDRFQTIRTVEGTNIVIVRGRQSDYLRLLQ